ncbi:MAG: metallophosphoesterase [Clostridiales bacterium]|nr:metallophosphoesterase [Clostridiales bacterium]
MKKKLILVFLVLFIIALATIVIFKEFNSVQSSAKPDADLSFAVLSDIHGNEGNLQNAIDDLYSVNSYMDALVLNGDTVDQGLDKQYDDIKDVLSKNSDKLPDTIIKNIGNHEYYDYDAENITEADVECRVNKYLEFAGTNKTYHDSWIKGYHFISLGSDYTGTEKVNAALISDEQLNWLRDTIKENYEEGKPIFVFLHQPIDMKFFNLNVKGVDKNEELKSILSNYPEVILFTSHTHLTPDKSADEEKQIVTVNTGSVNSNYVTDINSEKGFVQDSSYSNGIYVEVKDNIVIIKARDFKSNTWIYSRML